MVESAELRSKMRDVLDSVRTGAPLQMSGEEEPFLVLNPGYHDGQRASFLLLPSSFCQSTVLGPAGIARQDVWPTPLGRILTVTDRGVVLTIATATRMVHVTCDVTEDFRNLGGGGATMGSLDDAARADGWMVPWSDFDAVMTGVARHFGLTTTHRQLMKLPSGAVKGKGGES